MLLLRLRPEMYPIAHPRGTHFYNPTNAPNVFVACTYGQLGPGSEDPRLTCGLGKEAPSVKIVFTVELTSHHVRDTHLLEAYIRDAVSNFNIHTRTGANVGSVHLLSDAFEDRRGRLRTGRPYRARLVG